MEVLSVAKISLNDTYRVTFKKEGKLYNTVETLLFDLSGTMEPEELETICSSALTMNRAKLLH